MSTSAIVYLSLGSNLGDRYQNLMNAIDELRDKVGSVKLTSKTYENPPSGFQAETNFLNLCIEAHTNLSPNELLTTVKRIEKELGRAESSSKTYASRPIDIDIILYDNIILKTDVLTIPHPNFRKRMFVLKPLNDIARDKIDPETLLTIGQLFNNCSDQSSMSVYKR